MPQHLPEAAEAVVLLRERRVLAQQRALEVARQHDAVGGGRLQPGERAGDRTLESAQVGVGRTGAFLDGRVLRIHLRVAAAPAPSARAGRRLRTRLAVGALTTAPAPAPATLEARGALDAVVEQELVAGAGQHRGGRALHADTDDALVELAKLAHQRREVAVTRHDHERRHEIARECELHRVDRHLDVRGVLAHTVGALRDLDQLDVRIHHAAPVLTEEVPVGVGASNDQASPLGERVGQRLRVEAQADAARADRDVLVVDEDREPFLVLVR